MTHNTTTSAMPTVAPADAATMATHTIATQDAGSAPDTGLRRSAPPPGRGAARRGLRRTMWAVLATVIAAAALIVPASPAGASPDTSLCLHGARSIVWQTLPAGNNGGVTVDLYLYRYTRSGWAYTGYSARMRGTTGGYWIDGRGHMTQQAYFPVRTGSGTYVLRAHEFNANASRWHYIYGYADEFQGNTTYCRA